MALTDQQQNFISDLMAWAEVELQQRDKAIALVKRFDLNDMFNLMIEGDVPLIFPHLVKGEIIEAINALKAVRDVLNDNSEIHANSLWLMKG